MPKARLLMLSLFLASPVAAAPGVPWASADVVLAPLASAEAVATTLHESPDVAYAACRARWLRLGAVVCAAVVPQATAAKVQLSRGEVEWRVLGVLGHESLLAGKDLLVGAAAYVGAGLAAVVHRLDAAADAAAPQDLTHRGSWGRRLDAACAKLAGGLARVLGAFDSGGPGPYHPPHGVTPGSNVVAELTAALPGAAAPAERAHRNRD